MKYKEAGVDFKSLGLVKQKIKRLARRTYNTRVLTEIGLFGGLYEIKGYKKPVLVASTDSVGTKIKVAVMVGRHKSIGIDIVNHCINDILTLGAKPLFMLDYIGYTEIKPEIIGKVIEGIATACRKDGVSLIGGETAQLPGFYPRGEYDLVGFIIGVIEKGRMINGRKIKPNNVIVGFQSNGLHTNGYSLAREVLFNRAGYTVDTYLPEIKNTVGSELLNPHLSYYKKLSPHFGRINGIAHITGGGFYENIVRILPKGCRAVVKKSSWPVPPIFSIIQKIGNISEREMYNVFNMGIGIVAIVDRKELKLFKRSGGLEIGYIEKGPKEVIVKQ